jgi:formylglycine-generating enzyme required for sulfatase activity
VRLRPFGIGRYAVTNAEFGEFVASTGHVTDAERFGWSYVFHLFLPDRGQSFEKPVHAPWWRIVHGACWRRPEGPDSRLDDRHDHPVAHVSWNDAAAFASWAGGRLPSEAEWEFAASGGLDSPKFPWGDVEPDEDVVRCNIWQGEFPDRNTGADGFLGTAPVASFEPNGYGLYNMAGNVWEWCADAFLVRSVSKPAKDRNRQARAENEKILKGGSYLCHRSYCYRYRVAARTGRSPDTSAGHTGFRIAVDL